MRRALAVAAAAAVGALLAPPAATAAPAFALQAPTVQSPDAGYGVVYEARCAPRCSLRFSGHLERRGQRLEGVAGFASFGSPGTSSGFDFWYRWSSSDRARLTRALRDGPVTMVIDGIARDRTGSARRRLRIRLTPPAPASARTRSFTGRPFELPTPTGFRFTDPDKVKGLKREGDNAVLVPRNARLPRTAGYVEWDFTSAPDIAARSPRALRRIAARRVRTRFPSFERSAIAGRRVDGGRAFRFRIPDRSGARYVVSVVFYGDSYHEVDCLVPARPATARRALERACRAVLDGASLRF